ncbi:hypothetical protein MKQ70_13855 [Chitinophaga sedimenti]|uniref:hypothetical protein n=1 Tax=Chitinophaga sedimenti TaxID=2033606 RepID=UPI0020058CD2|nr:hypothetical protein [Chitinophaga sedimenti]MCK7556045.1 hypothetical protein [Chitinophaga sedimenti]
MNTKVIARYTEEELVTLLRQGDTTAFSYVYQQYAAPSFTLPLPYSNTARPAKTLSGNCLPTFGSNARNWTSAS